MNETAAATDEPWQGDVASLQAEADALRHGYDALKSAMRVLLGK